MPHHSRRVNMATPTAVGPERQALLAAGQLPHHDRITPGHTRSEQAGKDGHLAGLIAAVDAGVEAPPHRGGLHQGEAQQAGTRLLLHRRLVPTAACPGAPGPLAGLDCILRAGRGA